MDEHVKERRRHQRRGSPNFSDLLSITRLNEVITFSPIRHSSPTRFLQRITQNTYPVFQGSSQPNPKFPPNASPHLSRPGLARQYGRLLPSNSIFAGSDSMSIAREMASVEWLRLPGAVARLNGVLRPLMSCSSAIFPAARGGKFSKRRPTNVSLQLDRLKMGCLSFEASAFKSTALLSA